MSALNDEHTAWFGEWFNHLLDHVGVTIKGKRDQIAMALVAMLAEGHLLLEDVPGTGKTSLAKSLAGAVGGTWARVQFTPDLLPADVTGGLVYDQSRGAFDFHAGPIFANVVLGDEINRASPKTQSALLEVMEERQVTVGNDTHPVPRPFAVIATMNPVEQEGTYRLPEAQLDRFLMTLTLGYPDHDAEVDVLENVTTGAAAPAPAPAMNLEDVERMIAIAGAVHVDPSVRSYIVRLCASTREMPELRLGVSTRGAVALLRCSKVLAAAQGRVFVTPDDVKAAAHPVMAHRMLRTADAELREVRTSTLVERVLGEVAVPDAVRAG